jgi:NAD(P)-dependent dehydrogenase (short-subunit alcohol dehydrogenase family)
VKIEPGMVAVVTGAGSGIGRALAEHAACQGMVVVAADVEMAALDDSVEGIVHEGGQAVGVRTEQADRRLAYLAEEVLPRAMTLVAGDDGPPSRRGPTGDPSTAADARERSNR